VNPITLKIRPYTSDGFIVREIMTDDCYLTSLINQGDVVFDIGAHIGIFSALALTRTDKVFAYEPLKENCVLLRQNAPKATINPVAVSFDGSTENMKLLVGSFNKGDGKLNSTVGITVKCIRFDELIGEQIDFLKIDIEGSEVGLLWHPEWLAKVKIIAIETHDGMFKNFYNFLFSCGFRFLKTNQDGSLGLIVARKIE